MSIIRISSQSLSALDTASKISTIVIALFNACFAIYIYRKTSIKTDRVKEKDTNMQLLKTLVLDHNLKYYYSFFDDIQKTLDRLKVESDMIAKEDINVKVLDCFVDLRQKFIDTFLAIDSVLYDKILKSMDSLQDAFTDAIFDPGINLKHEPKYQEVIISKMNNCKTAVLKEIFQYRG